MSAVVEFRPRVGRPWHGGVYAGRLGAVDGIVGPTRDAPTTWSAAMAWAAGLSAYGCADFTLPSAAELQLLADAFPTYFSGTPPWWSRSTHCDLETDALVLLDGEIVHWGKCHAARTLGVRSVPN